jgi:hypothetical protein
MRSWSVLLSVCALAGAGVSCSKESSEIREWRAADHDHTAEPNSAQASPEPGGSAAAPDDLGIDEVTIVAWKQNCVRCHGVVGRGDGPQGASLRATDLSDPAWQARVSDQDISTVIQNGRGAMPAFPLPPATVQGLVRVVRLLNINPPPGSPGAAAGAAGAQPGAAPGAAAPAPAREQAAPR